MMRQTAKADAFYSFLRHDWRLKARLPFFHIYCFMFAPGLPSLSWLGQRGPRLVQAAAMLAVAAGIGLWGALLLAPRPAAAPPALASGPAPGQDVTPVANSCGGGSARLRVAVVGLMGSGERGAALLSVIGG